MSDETLYAAEPNRVLASGAETLDTIGLSFVVRSNGVTIEARTGSVSERTITIDYADIFAVDRVAEVAYGLRIETTETEYTVTNVTASLEEIERVVAAIQERITGLRSGTSISTGTADDPAATPREPTGSPSTADGGASRPPSTHDGVGGTDRDDGESPSDGDQAEGTESADRNGESSLGFDGDSRVTAYSGDTIECPACGHETLVPETIPPECQDVVCPGCSDVIGETDEGGECVYIDATTDP